MMSHIFHTQQPMGLFVEVQEDYLGLPAVEYGYHDLNIYRINVQLDSHKWLVGALYESYISNQPA